MFAGETADFSFDFSAYPADQGWSGEVFLTCASTRYSIALVANGSAMTATADAETTAAWAAGVYDLHVRVTHSDGRSRIAHQDRLAIKPDPSSATPSLSAYEIQLRKVDEAISAIVGGQGVQSYSITTAAGSRQIQRMSLAELRTHREWLLSKIDEDRAAMCERPRNQRWKTIGVKFRA